MTALSRFVWIAGASGVGKATLIRSLAEGRPDGLRDRFGLASPLRLMGPSIDRGWRDPLPIDDVIATDAGVSTVIKWQASIPMTDIEEIAKRRPDADHAIAFLYRNTETVLSDLAARDRHRDNFDWDYLGISYVAETAETVRLWFAAIRGPSLPVTAYDASAGLDGIYRQDPTYLD